MLHEFDDAYPSSEDYTTSVQAPEESKHNRQTIRGSGKQFKAFMCATSIQCDMVDAKSVQARTNLLEEHLRTRLNHTLPGAVKRLQSLSIAVITLALMQHFPSQSLSIFRPKTRLRIPSTRGLDVNVNLCTGDCVATETRAVGGSQYSQYAR